MDCHVFCTINITFKQPWKALFSLGYTTSQKHQVTENHCTMDFNVLSSKRKSTAGHPCFSSLGVNKKSEVFTGFLNSVWQCFLLFTAYRSGGLFLTNTCDGLSRTPQRICLVRGSKKRATDKFADKSSKMPIHEIATFEDVCINY